MSKIILVSSLWISLTAHAATFATEGDLLKTWTGSGIMTTSAGDTDCPSMIVKVSLQGESVVLERHFTCGTETFDRVLKFETHETAEFLGNYFLQPIFNQFDHQLELYVGGSDVGYFAPLPNGDMTTAALIYSGGASDSAALEIPYFGRPASYAESFADAPTQARRFVAPALK
jgi:hypothetical protein